MADSVVTEYGKKLEARLKIESPQTVDDVKLWLAEEGVEPQNFGLILAFGAKNGARKWYQQDGSLYAGRRPGATVEPTPRRTKTVPDLEDAQNQPTLKDQFRGLMESVGIEENQARAASNFCFGSFEMEDPAQIWQALRECLQIGQPGMKKQIWRLWTKTIRVDPPEALVQEIWGRAGLPPTQVRRYVAIDGEVIPTIADDSEGLPMADAARLASIQRGNNQKGEQTGGGLVTTLLQQQGETDRKRLDLEAVKARPEGESLAAAAINQLGDLVKASLTKAPDTSFETRIEAQRREFESRMESQNQRFLDLMDRQGERQQHMLEMVQTQNTHALDMIKQSMDGSNNQPSLLRQLEEFASSSIFEKLTKPAPAPVSMIAGPDGKGMMTLEVYKAMNEMEFKAQSLTLAKDNFPRLLNVLGDMNTATKQLAASRGHTLEDATVTEAPPPGEPTLMHTTCVHCRQSLSYPTGATFLVCPYCQVPQTAHGQRLVPQEGEVEVENIGATDLIGEPSKAMLEPPAEGSDQLMVRPATPTEVSLLGLEAYSLVPASTPPPAQPETAPEAPDQPELLPVTASVE